MSPAKNSKNPAQAPATAPPAVTRPAGLTGSPRGGPRTDFGKQNSARNSLRHGLAGERFVLLADEDPQEFAAFRARFLADAAPEGPVEELLAERALGCAWRLKRLGRIEAEMLQFLYDQDLVGRIEQSAGRVPKPTTRLGANVNHAANHGLSLKGLQGYEARLERSFYAALAELRRLQAKRRP